MKRLRILSRTGRGHVLMLLLLCCTKVLAGTDYYCDFSENGIYYLYIKGTTDEVAVSYDNYETGKYGGNYTNYSGYITVPSTVTHEGKTYTVTAVSDHAFQECSVTQVVLPNTIKSIGLSAFLDCYQLTYINLPQTITSIGNNAFNGCTALGTISLPSGIKTIGDNTFASCKSLTTITIPDGVTSIGSSAFQGCSNLSTISIPSSVESVGSSAFYGTAWYNNQPDGVIYIGDIVYLYKGTMPVDTHINLKDGTKRISTNAFASCANLTSITIPQSLRIIDSYAFSQCSGLTSITLPDDVTTIGTSAFSYCTSLTTFCIPNHLTYINSYMFTGCSSLASITIPSSVTTIGSSAFEGTLWYNNQPDGLVYAGNIAYKYKGTMPADTHIDLKEGTRSISYYAFQSCTNLVSIKIPNSVTKIENYAFDGCSGLKKVIVPDIAAWCNINMGNNTSNPLYYATHLYADENTEITDLAIPDGVTRIGYNTFINCIALTSVKLPKSLTEIGNYAFAGCRLTSLTVEATDPLPLSTTAITPNWVYVNTGDCGVKLFVPLGCKSSYENAEVWKTFREIVEYILPTDVSSLTDAIYANTVTTLKGKTVPLTVNLKNAQTTNGYSFDLKLPEGVTLAKDNNDEYIYTLSNRHNGHAATINYREATGVYSCAVLSLNSKDIKDNEGAILTLMLNISDEMAEGDYAVQIQNAKYSLSSGETSVSMEEAISFLTIENYEKGDANGDGSVDIADAVCIVNHIVGKATPAFIEAAADANGDSVVDIADAVRIVNLIVGKIDALARKHDIDYTTPDPE